MQMTLKIFMCPVLNRFYHCANKNGIDILKISVQQEMYKKKRKQILKNIRGEIHVHSYAPPYQMTLFPLGGSLYNIRFPLLSLCELAKSFSFLSFFLKHYFICSDSDEPKGCEKRSAPTRTNFFNLMCSLLQSRTCHYLI